MAIWGSISRAGDRTEPPAREKSSSPSMSTGQCSVMIRVGPSGSDELSTSTISWKNGSNVEPREEQFFERAGALILEQGFMEAAVWSLRGVHAVILPEKRSPPGKAQ